MVKPDRQQMTIKYGMSDKKGYKKHTEYAVFLIFTERNG